MVPSSQKLPTTAATASTSKQSTDDSLKTETDNADTIDKSKSAASRFAENAYDNDGNC